MPVTFPAHQGLIAWIKLVRPSWIDGTTLCIAAAAPDFAYAISPWANRESHTLVGLVLWAIPFSLVISGLVRWRIAEVLAPFLPDLGRLRLRSLGVLSSRRSRVIVTISSAVVGASSHILIDAFTHSGRWGSTLLGWDRLVFDAPVRGEFSIARNAQYVGHVGGSCLFVIILLLIAGTGRLEKWYGADNVERARQRTTTRAGRVAMASWLAACTALGAVLADPLGRPQLFLPINALLIGLVIAGLIVPIQRNSDRSKMRLLP